MLHYLAVRELPACRQRQARVRPALLRPNARLALARRGAHKRLQECRPQGHQRLPPLRVPHRHCIGHTAPCAAFAAKSDGTRQLATSVADATFEKGGMMAGRCVERTDTSCGAASSAECVDINVDCVACATLTQPSTPTCASRTRSTSTYTSRTSARATNTASRGPRVQSMHRPPPVLPQEKGNRHQELPEQADHRSRPAAMRPAPSTAPTTGSTLALSSPSA